MVQQRTKNAMSKADSTTLQGVGAGFSVALSLPNHAHLQLGYRQITLTVFSSQSSFCDSSDSSAALGALLVRDESDYSTSRKACLKPSSLFRPGGTME